MGLTGGITLTQYHKYPGAANVPLINQIRFPVGRNFSENFSGYMGAAPACPPPSKFVSGRGCCLQPGQQTKGNTQCCKAGNVKRVNKIGNKYSLSCGPPGGSTGPGEPATGSSSASFRVTEVSGDTIKISPAIAAPTCRGGKAWELRRPGVSGLGEFGGMVQSVNGNIIKHSGGTPPPKVGDVFIVYCAGQEGSSGGGIGGIFEGGIFGSESGAGSSLLTYGLIAAAVIGGYMLLKGSGGGPAPRYRR